MFTSPRSSHWSWPIGDTPRATAPTGSVRPHGCGCQLTLARASTSHSSSAASVIMAASASSRVSVEASRPSAVNAAMTSHSPIRPAASTPGSSGVKASRVSGMLAMAAQLTVRQAMIPASLPSTSCAADTGVACSSSRVPVLRSSAKQRIFKSGTTSSNTRAAKRNNPALTHAETPSWAFNWPGLRVMSVNDMVNNRPINSWVVPSSSQARGVANSRVHSCRARTRMAFMAFSRRLGLPGGCGRLRRGGRTADRAPEVLLQGGLSRGQSAQVPAGAHGPFGHSRGHRSCRESCARSSHWPAPTVRTSATPSKAASVSRAGRCSVPARSRPGRRPRLTMTMRVPQPGFRPASDWRE